MRKNKQKCKSIEMLLLGTCGAIFEILRVVLVVCVDLHPYAVKVELKIAIKLEAECEQ